MNVVRHRRPSFMKTPSARSVYVQSDFARKQGPNMASVAESFSYNPEYLKYWDMPAELWSQLPPKLTAEIEGWQAAGAAVLTGLRRIARLDDEAPTRGWPVKRSGHLSRTTSNAASGLQSMQAPTPPLTMSPNESFGANSNSAFGGLPRLQTSNFLQSPPMHAIVDTPPFTPEDVKPTEVPLSYRTGRLSIDPLALNDRLAYFAGGSGLIEVPEDAPLSPIVSCDPQFDEGSWETFLGQYNEEIRNLKVHGAVRFRHIRRGIDQIWYEVSRDTTLKISGSTAESFVAWWKTMQVKQKEYDDEVQTLKTPDLETVKLERISRGFQI